MIQEKADKDISSVDFFNPEPRENAWSGIKAPKRARRKRNNQNWPAGGQQEQGQPSLTEGRKPLLNPKLGRQPGSGQAWLGA